MMKIKTMLLLALFSLTSIKAFSDESMLKVGVVNAKNVVSKSKFGLQEQETFDAMKKQMETVLKEKEKKLTELANKLSDEDYLDSISPETETELKREFRGLSQEFAQVQNQYYQTLQQANMKIMQKLGEIIAKASEKVAKDRKLDLVLNEEIAFYSNPALDISEAIIKEMDAVWEIESKENKEKLPAAPQGNKEAPKPAAPIQKPAVPPQKAAAKATK